MSRCTTEAAYWDCNHRSQDQTQIYQRQVMQQDGIGGSLPDDYRPWNQATLEYNNAGNVESNGTTDISRRQDRYRGDWWDSNRAMAAGGVMIVADGGDVVVK